MDFKEQWEKVDMVFMKEFLSIHNDISFKKRDEKDFDSFVLANKEKLNNPDYLQVFAERVEIFEEYFEKHFEVCKFFYDFMFNNPDWEKLSFGLRTFMRLGMFQDLFGEYLAKQPAQ